MRIDEIETTKHCGSFKCALGQYDEPCECQCDACINETLNAV